MFSEYASRFLAQSQSRLSIGQPEAPLSNRDRFERHRSTHRNSPASQSYLQRRNMPNPYQPSGSRMGQFAFGSRTSAAPAPLFYSATDEFREEDDQDEHAREIEDLYALQKSRRHFGSSHLTESSEGDYDAERTSDANVERHDLENDPPDYGAGRGIKSSWRGEKPNTRGRAAGVEPLQERDERDKSVPLSEASEPSSGGRGKLVDVELASTIRGSMEDLRAELEADGNLLDDANDQPPAFQQFRNAPRRVRSPRTRLPIHKETDEEALLDNSRPISPDRESVPAEVQPEPIASPRHDRFWAEVFIIGHCALLGAFFIALLQTSPPDKKHPIGDTIYTALHSSFHLLAVYSLVSIVVGLLWLAMLRSFVKPLILGIVVSVPVILFAFFLYPLVSSFKGTWHGGSVQDKAMRWFSFVPAVLAVMWVYTVWKGRHSLTRATELLEFTGRILTTMSPLLLVGFATLATVVLWTWLWILMFTRLFLEGHFSKSRNLFIIDFGTWWLGAAFVLDYFWTLAVISGIQRATTAATVSQWYFHRNSVPSPSPRVVVQASATHASTIMFGTICLSTFLSLAVRLPLIILPRRVAGIISLFAYSLIPTPIASLTNPLTLTYASVHGQPLGVAARNLSQMSFVSNTSPTTTLSPGSFSSPTGTSLVPYRLAKLLLHATRFIMCLTLGFGGWVTTARMIEVPDSGVKGSMYAYVIGIIAGAIGWGILGAMEGVLGGILDALVVCWGSEVGVHGFGEVRYCREAGDLFAERPNGGRFR
ncbi:hypothetical protein BU16DRAFT_492768 [Lophium mytilinum]|uniref:Protein PNS1 n=1 Tax=Lophium mytilinum TaxID=390894 RepID=A0A6A6QHU6_9PEZI|nr:hypothetical protein BU16DRAFT_492768 [Lophium mytilinum]